MLPAVCREDEMLLSEIAAVDGRERIIPFETATANARTVAAAKNIAIVRILGAKVDGNGSNEKYS
jgi:hypothetical protein